MEEQKVPIDKLTGARFVRAVWRFANSEFGLKAKLMLAWLIALLFSINGLNVVTS
jgi:putative ATP-binding cassette transporter